jgi:hypothetical protein
MKRRVNTPEPEGFAEFWQVWQPRMRHTDGRGDARECFRKHILMGADPRDIIDGATGFFRFMQERDKQYVPLAASWLNKEAYTDWAAQERAYQLRMAEIEARRTQSPPKPLPEPVQAPEQTAEERAAMLKRVHEKFGMRFDEVRH